jgi:hypothetical protein
MGCVLYNDGKWHQVISDPRKNMLLDIKNESQEDAVKDFIVQLEESK